MNAYQENIEKELLPFAQRLMRKTVKMHLSRVCRDLFEHIKPEPDHSSYSIEFGKAILAGLLPLLQDLFDILRRGAKDPALRHAELMDVLITMDLLHVQLIRPQAIFVDHLINFIIRRNVNANRLEVLSRPRMRVVESIPLLTDSERAACIRDLSFEKIDHIEVGNVDFIDDAVSTWITVIRMFYCRQAVIVAIDQGLDFNAIIKIREIIQTTCDILAARSTSQNTAAIETPQMSDGDDDIGSTPMPKYPMPPLALHNMLLLPPVSWPQFIANWTEHLGDIEFVGEKPSEEDWNWLTHGAHYLIAFPSTVVISSAKTTVQYWMRLLVALSRCFRAHIEGSHFSQLNDGDLGAEILAGPRCRMLAFPLELPEYALSKMRPSDEKLAQMIKPSRAEFILAGRPFVIPEEIEAGWLTKLERAWKWLSSESSVDADRLRRVVESYEIACTFVRSTEIPPVHREGWELVALMTTAELLLCEGKEDSKKSEMCDKAQRILRDVNESDIDKCCARLRNGYEWRNDFIHGDACNWSGGDISEIRWSVGIIIRAALARAVRDR